MTSGMQTRSGRKTRGSRRRGTSLYRSVADALRRQVVEGNLPAGGKIPSLRALAKEFNVSTMTVNQALRMLQQDGLLSYIPAVGAFVREPARSAAATAHMTIAFVTIEIESVFTSRVASGIAEACRNRGWALQIYNADTQPDIEAQNVAQLPGSGITGAIMLPTSDERNFEAMFRLKLDGFPFVLVDRRIQGLKVDVVESDHQRGGYMATEHLLAMGHRRVYMLTCESGLISSADARRQGYERALMDQGIEPLREWCVESDVRCPEHEPRWLKWYEAIRPVLEKLKEQKEHAAFVTLNAYAARGLPEACRNLGLRIAHDVSLVSFDDSEFMQANDPPITVIAQRTREIGRAALEQLDRRIQAKRWDEPQQIAIPMDLIERGSVKRV